MKLILYRLNADMPTVRRAPVERKWMDDTPQGFAYRCLPLNIANSCGWEVLCPVGFEAYWDGGAGKDSIKIHLLDKGHPAPTSHFGSGVLTFHLSFLIRTETDLNLWVQGPVNRPKDGIAALCGVIETDWSTYTFTMNWQFTRPNHVIRFEKDEPFCFFFPLSLDVIEQSEPEIRTLDDDPDLNRRYHTWSESRLEFNKDLGVEGTKARSEKWQKSYFRGVHPDGDKAETRHRSKVVLKDFPITK